MKIVEALKEGTRILKNAGIESPALEAGVILCNVIGCEKAFIYSHGEYILREDMTMSFLQLVEVRCRGTPLQYITGHQEFMSLDFNVGPDVLIPRHDTEILVEAVIDHVKDNKASQSCKVRILDIGTGSGCIAISLAHFINDCEVTAVDVSEKALDIARINAIKNNVSHKIFFLKSSLFDNVEKEETFDVIVSNPPYIPTPDIQKLQIEVRDYEPLTALDGGKDGLDFYRAISQGALECLKPSGLLALEIGYNQAEEVLDLMGKLYKDTKYIKDISGNRRVVTGHKL